jgi:hypothetical protein
MMRCNPTPTALSFCSEVALFREGGLVGDRVKDEEVLVLAAEVDVVNEVVVLDETLYSVCIEVLVLNFILVYNPFCLKWSLTLQE